MQRIIEFLQEKYDPLALIVYGSYADGKNGEHSDFDCLIVSRTAGVRHDTSIADGVPLDAFVYTPEEIKGKIDPFEFVQIENGIIVTDADGIAESLMQKVRAYLSSLPVRSREELKDSLMWCEKMAKRCTRGDAEGYFRWHWLLCDSLELYCDLIGKRYLGPKKSLHDMEKHDPESFTLYSEALQKMTRRALTRWIDHLKRISEKTE